MSYVSKTMKSPVGVLKLVGSDAGPAAVLWEHDDPRRVKLEATVEDADHPILVQAERQLNEYLVGERKAFTVKLDNGDVGDFSVRNPDARNLAAI